MLPTTFSTRDGKGPHPGNLGAKRSTGYIGQQWLRLPAVARSDPSVLPCCLYRPLPLPGASPSVFSFWSISLRFIPCLFGGVVFGRAKPSWLSVSDLARLCRSGRKAEPCCSCSCLYAPSSFCFAGSIAARWKVGNGCGVAPHRNRCRMPQRDGSGDTCRHWPFVLPPARCSSPVGGVLAMLWAWRASRVGRPCVCSPGSRSSFQIPWSGSAPISPSVHHSCFLQYIEFLELRSHSPGLSLDGILDIRSGAPQAALRVSERDHFRAHGAGPRRWGRAIHRRISATQSRSPR